MKKLFFVSITLISSLFAFSQQDGKAKSILEQVSSKTRSYKTIVADFSFTLDNEEMEIHEANNGTIQLKNNKYVVELPGPGVKIYSDGETLWNYMKSGNQVTISKIDGGSGDLMDPSSLFSIYEKGFRSKFIEEKNEGGKKLYIIELYPDDDSQDISKISLAINKAKMMIESAILFGTDGNLYGIVVQRMEPNKDLPDSNFVFNADSYDDIEIIDLR